VICHYAGLSVDLDESSDQVLWNQFPQTLKHATTNVLSAVILWTNDPWAR
jgi:hypothetical protein